MTLSRRWVRGAVWVVLLMTGSILARAQEVSGSISGTVVDTAGAVVADAVVTFTNTDRAYVERTLKTSKAGYFATTSLPLGDYSLSIAATGFKTVSVTGLVLHANDSLRIDQKLMAGSAGDTVKVMADWAMVNLKNGVSSGLVTGTQIRELELSTRNYEQLLTLQPGVSYGGASDQLYSGGSFAGGIVLKQPLTQDSTAAYQPNQVIFSVDGLRPTTNNWMVDGADNVDRGAGLTLLTHPSVDAISEFVTLRGSYDAQYGRNAGGQVNVVTRSGTSALHGGAYEFFRNDVMNANNYFNNLVGVSRPKLRYNDFGFSLGGPVVIPHYYNGRSKTFFFYSQEFRRVVNYASATSYAPTPAELSGDFTNSYLTNSAGQYTGATGPVAVCSSYTIGTGVCTQYNEATVASTNGDMPISKTAQAYVNQVYKTVLPPQSAADLAAGLDPHTLTNNMRNVYNDNQEFARIDHSFGPKTNLFYHFLRDDLPTTEGGGLFIGGGMPGVSTTSTKSPGTQHVGHLTVAAHPTLLLDMGYAYSSGSIKSTPIGTVSSINSPGVNPSLPYTNTLGVVPSITYLSGNISGITSNGNYNESNVNHNGFGSITKVYREHTVKLGISYNHYQKLESATGTGNQGSFSFGSATAPSAKTLATMGASAPSTFDSEFANFLIGNANGGYTQASIAPTANLNEDLVELYAQDDWRVSRRLTVNLGVRYSYFGQPYDINNELSNFDPSSFSSINAETISSTGSLCTVAGQSTAVTSFSGGTVSTTTYIADCPNANGLNAYQPNTIADPLNGIRLGGTDYISAVTYNNNLNYPFVEPSGAPSIDTHASLYGQEIGQAEKHDFAPRIGFAYDVFGNGKTSLRGGFGMVYDQSPTSIYAQEVFNNLPYVTVQRYTAVQLDSPSSNTALSNLVPPSLRATPVIYKTPYVQQYSLDLQQEITPTLKLDLGYVGNHGTHLQGVVDINEVKPGAFTSTSIGYSQVAGCNGFTSQACEAPLNQIRPYLGYSAINDVENIFNSNYNSLQVKVTKKLSGKSMLDANYTWSRSLTNAPSDYSSAPQNSYNLAAEYGPSAYNRNEVLTIDGIWELPWMKDQKGIVGRVVGGWEVSGIYAVSSGLPLTATMDAGGTVSYGGLTSLYNGKNNGGMASDAAGLGILGTSMATLRPTQISNPNSGNGQTSMRTRQHWFNQTAFLAPSAATFQLGNEHRGVITGPGFNRLDVGLFRNFKLYRGSEFQLRGEGFNVLNHTNFATIGTDATSNTFGQATSARDPRILQVGGKVSF